MVFDASMQALDYFGGIYRNGIYDSKDGCILRITSEVKNLQRYLLQRFAFCGRYWLGYAVILRKIGFVCGYELRGVRTRLVYGVSTVRVASTKK